MGRFISYAALSLITIPSLACWIALAVLSLITAAYLAFLNKRHAARRIAVGKAGVVVDASLEDYAGRRTATEGGVEKQQGETLANERAFDDLTNLQNEDFIYAL